MDDLFMPMDLDLNNPVDANYEIQKLFCKLN